MKTYLLIDVEGEAPDIVEFSILVCQNQRILHVFHDCALPSNKVSHNQKAPYCHCISYSTLYRITANTPQQLLDKARAFVVSYTPAVVLSNDKVFHSDIYKIVSSWKLNLCYHNVYLGDWLHRAHQAYHLEARSLKFHQSPICNRTCTLHHLPLCQRKPTPTNLVKRQHGAHCSLYDAYEIFLFLRHAWPSVAATCFSSPPSTGGH